ncbi:MAG: DUF4097 domain-containing protein [Chloroflexota bacterium]|nr:DUF4097 domain-containing protein [Chloroflexota bacterium]
MSRDRDEYQERRRPRRPAEARYERPRPRPQAAPRAQRREEVEYQGAPPEYEHEPYEQVRRQHRPRGRAWPWMLGGCAGGILLAVLAAAVVVFIALRSATPGGINIINPSTQTYTQSNRQTVSLNGITQLQVNNPVGDITVQADATVPNSQAVVTAIKKVKAGNQDDANAEFKRITVALPSSASTLSINAAVPDNSTLNVSNDAVDILITLPTNLNTARAPFTLTANASVGNVTLNGVNGIMNVKNDAGNITIRQGQLFPGSSVKTATGNVTFAGTLNTTSSNSCMNPNSAPCFRLHSEVGNLDVTLPASTDVTLDASVNTGKITSDFAINVTTTDSSASYHGPLTPSSTSLGVLHLDVGSGNITLHKA